MRSYRGYVTWLHALSAASMLVGCGGDGGRIFDGPGAAGGEGGRGGGVAGGMTGGGGEGGSGAGGGDDCPTGVICVNSFPFTDLRDTSSEGQRSLESYSCAPGVDESGPEIIYRVTVPEDGFLSAAVYEDDGVDVDVHILEHLDEQACLDRGNYHARADVAAGFRWVVADTYVDGSVEMKGPFTIDIGFIEPSIGPCDMVVGEMPRVGDNGEHLPMPAIGPIVCEAHLVTQDEPPPYPSTSTEELLQHYDISQAASGLIMHRDNVWAPLEGGSFYGCGIGSPEDFPALHEAWYVNMYWTAEARPDKGTRMILRDPYGGSRAVVVAAGYETGPGDLDNIGGSPEETHFYMGTEHLDDMELGIAVDQALPFGPRRCQ